MAMKFPERASIPAGVSGGGEGGEKEKDLIGAIRQLIGSAGILRDQSYSARLLAARREDDFDITSLDADERLGVLSVDMENRMEFLRGAKKEIEQLQREGDALRGAAGPALDAELTRLAAFGNQAEKEYLDLDTLFETSLRLRVLRHSDQKLAHLIASNAELRAALIEAEGLAAVERIERDAAAGEQYRPEEMLAEQRKAKPELLRHLARIEVGDATSAYVREALQLVHAHVESLGQQTGSA